MVKDGHIKNWFWNWTEIIFKINFFTELKLSFFVLFLNFASTTIVLRYVIDLGISWLQKLVLFIFSANTAVVPG